MEALRVEQEGGESYCHGMSPAAMEAELARHPGHRVLHICIYYIGDRANPNPHPNPNPNPDWMARRRGYRGPPRLSELSPSQLEETLGAMRARAEQEAREEASRLQRELDQARQAQGRLSEHLDETLAETKGRGAVDGAAWDWSTHPEGPDGLGWDYLKHPGGPASWDWD